MAYEEANYEVVKKNEIYEIRKYSDRLAIETEISNQGSSFRKLFNYISGNNEDNEEIKMTTPVTQVEKKGNMTMQFYLPSRFDKNFIKHKSILENELKKDDMSILSPPIKATYNGPFTLPMNRRNEVMFEINVKDKGEI